MEEVVAGPMHSARTELLIYGNVLLNSSTKLENFRNTLPLWLNYWRAPAKIRLRGEFATTGYKFCSRFTQVEAHLGHQFRTWRYQALSDIRETTAPYIFQLFEDHMPHPDAPAADQLMAEISERKLDVLQYSWFPTYAAMRSALVCTGGFTDKTIVSRELEVSDLETLDNSTKLYVVSLSSIFEREFYYRLLSSHRPWIRKFDPKSPFDVEQKGGSTWFAPLTYGVVRSELGVCLDDDHLVEGSSARSRGLVDFQIPKREINHHSAWSLRNTMNRRFSKSIGKGRQFSRIFGALDTLIYSLHAPILRLVDWHASRSLSPSVPNFRETRESRDSFD